MRRLPIWLNCIRATPGGQFVRGLILRRAGLAPPMPSAASGGGFAMCMCLGLCMHWPIKKAWPPLQSMHISRRSKGWRKRPGVFDRST